MTMILAAFTIASLLLKCVASQSCSLDPDGEADIVKVLVLGGGIAGITAARTLKVNGIDDFIVLEASDVIGGRIREFEETNIELGANWIQGLDPNAPELHPIWREWTECDSDGPDGSITPDISLLFDENGTMINITEYKSAADQFYEAFDDVGVIAEKLKGCEFDISMRDGFKINDWEPNSALENFTDWLLVDFCIAIPPEHLSAKLYYYQTAYTDFVRPWAREGEEGVDYYVIDDKGYSFVVECMTRGFKEGSIKLSSSVTIIQTADDCVCATLQNDTRYCGEYAIVTFSIGVLQAAINNESFPDSVQFDPLLPDNKQNAINNVTLVHYGKIHLTFNENVFSESFFNKTLLKKAFSEDTFSIEASFNETFSNKTFCNESQCQYIIGYVSRERGEYPYFIFDTNHPNTITVDVTGNMTIRIANQSNKTTVDEVMDILREIFGENIADPDSVIITNWTNDPLFRCTYTAFAPGVSEDIFEQLLAPVGRLYFAGESLNHSNYGFTQGAYGSGAHVAKMIVSEIKNSAESLAEVKVIVGTTTLGVLLTLQLLLY